MNLVEHDGKEQLRILYLDIYCMITIECVKFQSCFNRKRSMIQNAYSELF